MSTTIAEHVLDVRVEPNADLDENANSSHTGVTLGTIIGNCAQHDVNGQAIFWLVASDLDKYTSFSVPLMFFGHGISKHPENPNLFAVFEKRGKGACEVDLEAQRVVRMIETKPEREFYGHGTYIVGRDELFAAETVVSNNHEGLLVVRDSNTMQELDAFPTYGSRPHDLHLLSDNKTLMVTNGGGLYGEKEKGSVALIDVDSYQLIEKYEVDNTSINAGHVARSANGNMAVVSAPRDGITVKKPVGGITIGGGSRPFVRAIMPPLLEKRLKGETLSVCVDEKNQRALTTTPDAGLALVWDMKNGKLVKKFNLEMPKGVCLTANKKHFVISHIENGPGLTFIDVDSLEIDSQRRLDAPFTGSHLFNTALL